MSKFLRYKKTGHIVTLTMNEPDSMNALSGPDQYADFEKYCARINQDYDVRCAILEFLEVVFDRRPEGDERVGGPGRQVALWSALCSSGKFLEQFLNRVGCWLPGHARRARPSAGGELA